MKNGIILLLAVLIVACNSSDSEDKCELTPQQHWDAMLIDSYTFEYQETDFSPLSGLLWEVQVADGEVIYVNFIGEGTPPVELNIDSAPTIDELFISITECEASSHCDVTLLKYDEKYYYPTQYNSATGEEALGFEILNFIVQ